MSTDIIQKILDKTDGGLDIILWLYPDAEKCIGNNKHFKLVNEKTASATVYKHENGNYYVNDFGGRFKGSAINLYMFTEGKSIKEAIKFLGNKYEVFDNIVQDPAEKPIRSKRPATVDEIINSYTFVHKDALTESDILSVYSKKVVEYFKNLYETTWINVLNKVCTGLAFSALVSYTYIGTDKETSVKTAFTTTATERYPIFLIKGDGFNKIYSPKSKEKKYRFRYEGKKPENYVFGLKRLEQTFIDGELQWLEGKKDDADKKEGNEFKLDNAILCSGDADALNVAAIGYMDSKGFGNNVIWLNSEGSMLPQKTWNDLRKKCHNIYNIPDLDNTGVKKAHEKALTYLELKTVQLPAELKLKRDWRKNPCKDVRDFLDHYTKYDFDKLLRGALEYKFWDEEITYNKENKPKGTVYVFNDVRAYNFLRGCGFYKLISKTSKEGYEFVKITNNVVKIIKPTEIKKFINDFLEENYTADQKLRNTMFRSTRLKEDSLDNLKFIEIDFKSYDKSYQYMFFKNQSWEITPTEINTYHPDAVEKMVWDTKVIQQYAKLLQPPFTITKVTSANGTEEYDIEIHNYDDLFFRYIVNTSRIYWREELEDRCDAKYSSEEDRAAYRERNKFKIDGELLSPDEIAEQKKHLINKIFLLGYCIGRYKEPSKAWSPFIMDHKLSAEGESHGGSGKSLMLEGVKYFTEYVYINGKDKGLVDDKFVYEQITEKTEFVLIDDLARHTPIEPFFNIITGGMTINPKYNARFTIDYSNSPKIAFTSNFGVKDLGPSAARRLIYGACCDYYHNNLSNNYREERRVADDFGKNLYTDFTEDEWNLFINFMARCLQFYFQVPSTKINPPMDNVVKRNLMGVMGDSFFNWVEVFFEPESGRRNVFVPKQEAFNDFIKNNNIKNYSSQQFIKAMHAWCDYKGFVFNPEQLQNKDKRIIRKAYKRDFNGKILMHSVPQPDNTFKDVPQDKISTEMFYVQTEETLDMEALKENKEAPAPVAQNNIVGGQSLFNAEEDDFIP